MPSQTIVDRFVATVLSGDYVGAIERFYTPGASMQENQDAPRVGRDALAAHERGLMGMFRSIGCEILGAPLVAGDRVAINWRFTFTPQAGGSMSMEEVAWQRWEGEEIAEEVFFYDPRQMAPAAA